MANAVTLLQQQLRGRRVCADNTADAAPDVTEAALLYAAMAAAAYRTTPDEFAAHLAATHPDAAAAINTAGGKRQVFATNPREAGGGDRTDANLFTVAFSDRLVFCFRGTEPAVVADLRTDLDIPLEPFVDAACGRAAMDAARDGGSNPAEGALVHAGFLAQWNTLKWDIAASVYHELRKAADPRKAASPMRTQLIFCGHSLGGALATLAAAWAKAQFGGEVTIGCYTIGSPRVGNDAFVRFVEGLSPAGSDLTLCRVTGGSDFVPKLPPRGFLSWFVPSYKRYRHVLEDAAAHAGPPDSGFALGALISGAGAEDHRCTSYYRFLGLTYPADKKAAA